MILQTVKTAAVFRGLPCVYDFLPQLLLADEQVSLRTEPVTPCTQLTAEDKPVGFGLREFVIQVGNERIQFLGITTKLLILFVEFLDALKRHVVHGLINLNACERDVWVVIHGDECTPFQRLVKPHGMKILDQTRPHFTGVL